MDSNPKLWSKDFTLMVIGQIISLFGNAILRFALPLYILEMSKSAALFGRVSALSFLPMVLLSPVGGIIADRMNKQRIMVVLDFTTSVLILLYIIVSGFISTIPVVVVMLMALYAIQGVYTPAVQSSIPILVRADSLVSANAVVNLVTSLSGMVGPILGGILYGTFGLWPVLIVSGISFFVSAILELFIHIPYNKQKTSGNVLEIAKADMSDSIHFITKEKPILSKCFMVIFLFNLVLSSMILIGLPVLITQNLGIDSRLYGVTQGVMAAGGLMSGVLAGILGKKLVIQRIHILLLICSLSLFPIGLVFFIGASDSIAYLVITIMCFFTMAAATLFQIQISAFVQAETPEKFVGKVMSCLIALALCAQPIGQILFGQLFETFAALPWIVVFGSVVVSCTIALYSRKHFRKIGL